MYFMLILALIVFVLEVVATIKAGQKNDKVWQKRHLWGAIISFFFGVLGFAIWYLIQGPDAVNKNLKKLF